MFWWLDIFSLRRYRTAFYFQAYNYISNMFLFLFSSIFLLLLFRFQFFRSARTSKIYLKKNCYTKHIAYTRSSYERNHEQNIAVDKNKNIVHIKCNMYLVLHDLQNKRSNNCASKRTKQGKKYLFIKSLKCEMYLCK